MKASQFLRAVFEGDPRSREYAELNYCEAGLGLGTKPWWPPLAEVWRRRGERPEIACPQDPRSWREALALLERLHEDFLRHQRHL